MLNKELELSLNTSGNLPSATIQGAAIVTATPLTSNTTNTSANKETLATPAAAPTAKDLSQWKLIELVHIGPHTEDLDGLAPMQLLKFAGKQPEAQGPLLVIAGFRGPARNDNRLVQLMQRALATTVIKPASDIYLCPIANPNNNSKAQYLNIRGQDILNDFPTQKNTSASDLGQSAEVSTLLRWIQRVKPKAIISIDEGECVLSHHLCPSDVIEKLKTLSERPVLGIGEKLPQPIVESTPENPVQAPLIEEPEIRNFEKHLGQWCLENEIIWLSVAADSAKKNFEEMREDWRINLGPAIKWLFEGPRFNPPEEDPFLIAPTVITTVDLPPELLNL